MSWVDVDALLQAGERSAPCGPNLEYDPGFVELELAVLGKPEVQYGKTIIPAVPPEWKLIKRVATDLLGRSRDLRLAVHLLRANLALHGVGGLADSLGLIERLLEERWDSVHPELDVDDDLDSTLRVNSLAVLADGATVLKDLKDAALLTLPGLGPLSLRVLDIASGELAPSAGQEKLAVSSIAAALGDIDEATLSAVAGDLHRAYESAVEIEVILVRRVGSAQTINLDALTRALKRGSDFLTSHLAGRKGLDEQKTVPEDAAVSDEPAHRIPSVSTAGSANLPLGNSEIANRADVLRTIDKILKYYQQYEPSSPVPLLLGRAKRLVPKSFLEIMEDLAPDALANVLTLSGNNTET